MAIYEAGPAWMLSQACPPLVKLLLELDQPLLPRIDLALRWLL
jgi:hypothetical protein